MEILSTADTGIDLERLQGQQNYIRWARDFKLVAQAKGVWRLITGAEALLPRPHRTDYFQTTRKAPLDESKDDIPEEDVTPMTNQEISVRIAEYKLDLEEFEKNEKKVRGALTLITYWVDPAVRGNLQEFTDPWEAWLWLKQQYAMQPARALDLAHQQMEKIKLSQCKSMQEYLNNHEMCKLDIADAGGEYSEQQLMSKIIRGLSSQYNSFVDQYYFLQDTEGLENPGLRELTSRLLTFESKLRERTTGAQANAVSGNQSENKADDGNKKKRDRCTVEGCKKWGHTEAKCWIAHPELKKEKDNKKDNSEQPRRVIAMAQINRDDFLCKATDAIKTNVMSTHLPADSNPWLFQADHVSQRANEMQTWEVLGRQGLAGQKEEGLEGEAQHQALMLIDQSHSFKNDTWIIDSGANLHMTNVRSAFKSFTEMTYVVETAEDNASLQIEGVGTVILRLIAADGEVVELELTNVAYAPCARCSVVSLSALIEVGGLSGTWGGDGITIETQGHVIGRAVATNGLFHLEMEVATPAHKHNSAPIVATVDFSNPVWKWHRRMGHLSLQSLRKLLRMSDGITDITDKQIKNMLGAVCPVCATTNAIIRIPRDPATRQFKLPGECIHIDIWGPYAVLGWDKTKYMFEATDGATRFSWTTRLKNRAEVTAAIIRTHKMIEKTYNVVIRRYRSDMEITNRTVIEKEIGESGVTFETSVAYSHHQNGVSERVFRTEREKAASMLQEVALPDAVKRIISGRAEEMMRVTTVPEFLWPEAFEHAVWLKNRSPTKALKNKVTPWEKLTSFRPNLSRERIWGSRAYVSVPDELRMRNTKLAHPRGWLGYFVRCESESVYWIYNPALKKPVRVSAARIEDGEGLDDNEGPTGEDRVSLLKIPQYDGPAEDEESGVSDLDSSDDLSDHSEYLPDDDEENQAIEEDAVIEEDTVIEENAERSVQHEEFDDLYDVSPPHSPRQRVAVLEQGGDVLQAPTVPRQLSRPVFTSAPLPFDQRRMVPNQPAPHKCDYCFRKVRACVGGFPCNLCKDLGIACIEQNEESKLLIPAERRELPPVWHGVAKGDKCHYCHVKNQFMTNVEDVHAQDTFAKEATHARNASNTKGTLGPGADQEVFQRTRSVTGACEGKPPVMEMIRAASVLRERQGVFLRTRNGWKRGRSVYLARFTTSDVMAQGHVRSA
ncbi:hypothetical protein V490_03519 [Pseudogymnoascus sp. VKM F-3557]|nr:hypothetical protein V490_03519 [Pseudogymnoascus sp. VKM F-3557]